MCAGVTWWALLSFLVGSCGNRLSWHDSSSERACGVPRDVMETTYGALTRQHEERGYRFRWCGLIVGTVQLHIGGFLSKTSWDPKDTLFRPCGWRQMS
ncbi:hypothetical protein DY000_02033943 [Brassica cretica]|uniref:Secreted protein n=1 Tax=Brassica cretica TaxID=69181 RepID=A0ABQ7DGP4_BRACR|nr:hypothetical protein DY000_02033943 [Brassica cretica]